MHALEVERLGDDSDRQNSGFASRASDHRRGAGSGSASHAGGHKHHVGMLDLRQDVVQRFFSGGAADVRARSGAETLCDAAAELQAALADRLL